MFVTHFASGLAFYARKRGSKVVFFILVLGTQFADLLWGLFTIFGIEGGKSGGTVKHNYFDIPWSHSLLMIIIWSIGYGILAQIYMKRKYPELSNLGLFAGLSVFSHWLFDFPVHNDDMLLTPFGDSKVPTLYLWEYPLLTFILEIVLVGIFWYYYWSSLNSESKASRKPLISLIMLLILHVIGYLPSFTNTDPVDSNLSSGIAVMAMISLIAIAMTWLHPMTE